jgi:GNAT superfamily N-acetyltransferase
MSAAPAVTFEPARDDDLDALVALRIAAMRDSLQRLGRFDPERARQRLAASWDAGHARHVLVDGLRVGCVVVRPVDDDLLLDHLYLLPSHQGRGVGAAVLGEVFARADAQGRRVRVSALRDSDANRFYLRHGFELRDEGEWDNHYVRPARGMTPAAP